MDSVNDLINVLEKRLGVGPSLIKAMEIIEAHGKKAEKEVCNTWMVFNGFDNYSQNKIVESSTETAGVAHSACLLPGNTHQPNSATTEKEVLRIVGSKIGRSWIVLARQLGLEDAYIEELDNAYHHNIREATHKALSQFYSNKGTNKTLIEALRCVGRKDIARLVMEKIHE